VLLYVFSLSLTVWLKEANKTRDLTSSLDRRRPIVALPDVEQAIETDNLRRYWYVSERSVLSEQYHRPPPPPPPPRRHSPTPSAARGVASPPRSTSCEFRREYELAQDEQIASVLQLQTSRQGGRLLMLLILCQQWRRQLWGTRARAPSISNNFILLHFGVNLAANYPNAE